MQSLFVVVGVNNNKTTTCFIVKRTEPTFDKVENLTAYVEPFASILGRNSQTSNKNCGIIHSTFGICDTALQSVSRGIGDKLCFDTVISQSYQT